MKHLNTLFIALILLCTASKMQAQSISGTLTLCDGNVTTLSGTPAGGTWTSAMPVFATIGSATGIVTGLGSGTSMITYHSGSGTATAVVTVNPSPAAIAGASTVCAGSTIALSNATGGGTWVSSAPIVAAVGSSTGVVIGYSAGTAVISYVLPTGCFRTKVVTVNALPSPITGLSSICVTSSTTMSSSTAGGTWSSSLFTVAAIGSASGVVTGDMAGTATISYTLSTGCVTSMVVTVNPLPMPISGPSSVCAGSSIALSDATVGGTWSSSAPAVATVGATGIVSGVMPGTATISYTVPSGCSNSMVVTVNPMPTAITGSTTVCDGDTSILASTPGGGTWSVTPATVATITTSGILTGIVPGIVTVTYATGAGCMTTSSATVYPVPSAITGPSNICLYGSPVTFSCATTGGTWGSSAAAVVVIGGTGVATPITPGMATILYTLPSGCSATHAVTVDPGPAVSATATAAACGDVYAGVATGAATYSWAPASGVACTTCATTNINPTATTTYTITGTNTAGCTATTNVTVNGNRILGHITFSSAAPTSLGMKVWLIEYNPSDSSIVATDSMATCLDAGVPYYEFSGKPAGNYMVKAKLLSSTPGTSDYIPTYGTSTPNWYAAANISHTAGTDVQNINMVYGTVPAGPGFIAGYVYAGAGKGTSGEAPEAGMLVYLKNPTTGQVITYTYTNAAGGYSFSGLAYGSYMIFPEEYDFYTTPTIVTLSASAPGVTDVTFKKGVTSHTVYPFTVPTVVTDNYAAGIRVFPNPVSKYLSIAYNGKLNSNADVMITDVTGREVYKSSMQIDDARIDMSALTNGLYFISVKSAEVNYSGKFILQH